MDLNTIVLLMGMLNLLAISAALFELQGVKNRLRLHDPE